MHSVGVAGVLVKIAVSSELIVHVCHNEQAAHLQAQLRDGSRRGFAPIPHREPRDRSRAWHVLH